MWHRTDSPDFGDPYTRVIADLCNGLTTCSCHVLWCQPVAVESNVGIDAAQLLEDDMCSHICIFVTVEFHQEDALAQEGAVDVGHCLERLFQSARVLETGTFTY